MGPTYYEVLGLSPDATQADVRRAHRARARVTHPDLNPHSPKSLFELIQQAYEVLSDPEARARYDASLTAAEHHRTAPTPPPTPTPTSPPPAPQRPAAPTPPPVNDAHAGSGWVRSPHEERPDLAAKTPSRTPWHRALAGRSRAGLIVGASGVAAALAFAVVPATRAAFGSTLWAQLLALAAAVWLALRGRPVGVYVVAGLHVAMVVALALGGIFDGHPAEAWMLAVQSFAVAAIVYGAYRLRRSGPSLRERRRTARAAKLSGYGAPGYAWKRLGCLGWIVAILLAGPLSTFPTVLLSALVVKVGALVPPMAGIVSIALASVSFVGCLVLIAWAYGRLTRRPFFRCQSCGVQTHPAYKICRSCGRVKAWS